MTVVASLQDPANVAAGPGHPPFAPVPPEQRRDFYRVRCAAVVHAADHRPYALAFGVAMHFGIDLMFGPVIWFSLLMIILLGSSYAREQWLVRVLTPRREPA